MHEHPHLLDVPDNAYRRAEDMPRSSEAAPGAPSRDNAASRLRKRLASPPLDNFFADGHKQRKVSAPAARSFEHAPAIGCTQQFPCSRAECGGCGRWFSVRDVGCTVQPHPATLVSWTLELWAGDLSRLGGHRPCFSREHDRCVMSRAYSPTCMSPGRLLRQAGRADYKGQHHRGYLACPLAVCWVLVGL